jgi:hypothetical protein
MARLIACLISGAGCLTAAGWLSLGGWRPAPLPPEGLAVEPAVHDFGSVGQSETLPAEFAVTNNYRQPVRILELVKSCSCVALTADRTDLPPGESTTVRVAWRTHGKRGRVGDTLGVYYQVGDGPTVANFRLTADVVPDVSVSSERLRFGGRSPAEQTLTVSLRDPASDIRVTSAHCSAGAVAATVSADGRSVALRFDPAGRVPAGVAHRLLLNLSLGSQPWLEVPVEFESVQPLSQSVP